MVYVIKQLIGHVSFLPKDYLKTTKVMLVIKLLIQTRRVKLV